MNKIITVILASLIFTSCADRVGGLNSATKVYAEIEIPGMAIADDIGGISDSGHNARTYSYDDNATTNKETVTEVVFYIFDEAGGFVSKTSFAGTGNSSAEIATSGNDTEALAGLRNYRLDFPRSGNYAVYVLCNMSALIDLPETPARDELESLTLPHRESYDRLPFAGKRQVTVTGGTSTIKITLNRINSAIRIENRTADRVEIVNAYVTGLPSCGNVFDTGTAATGVTYSESAEADIDAAGDAVVYSFFVPDEQMADVKIEAEALMKGNIYGADDETENATVLAPLTFIERLEAGKQVTALMGYINNGLKIDSPDNWGNVGRYELSGGVRLQVIGGEFFNHGNAKSLRAYSGGSEFLFTVSADCGVASLRIADGSADWITIGDGVISVSPNTTNVGRECRIAVAVEGNNVGMFYVTQGKCITFAGASGTTVENDSVAVVGGRAEVASVKFDISSEELEGMEIVPVDNGENGITVSVDRKARTITASFVSRIDASEMDAEGVRVPVEFRDIHGTVRTRITFVQRPAVILFAPERCDVLTAGGGTVTVAVTTEDNARWTVSSITDKGGASATWIAKMSPSASAESGDDMVLEAGRNNGNAIRTAYVRVESCNTVSKPYEITQKPSYGIKTISADSSWYGTINTLKAYSKGRTYKFTFETDKTLPENIKLAVDCNPDGSGNGGITAGNVVHVAGNGYTFDLTVPDSDNAAEEVMHDIAVTANYEPIYEFTVMQAYKPSFVSVTEAVWGGVRNRPELKKALYRASVWDVKDFTSSNDKIPVTKISASEIEIAYAETLVYNDATQKATIAMNLNGGNRVTYATEQSPVYIMIEDIALWNGDMDGGEVDLTVTTKAGGSSSPWRVASVSDTWLRTIPGAGGPETNASGATLTLDIDANTGDKRVGYFTLESQNTTSQEFHIGQRDPYATVTIGGLQWMQYNLANPRQAPGGATFATALPSECTGMRLASHGKFYQWGYNVAWSTVGDLISVPSGSVWQDYSKAASWSDSPCPAGFRLPTNTEYTTLFNSCTHIVLQDIWGTSSGICGYIVITDRFNNKLEFPAVSNRDINSTLYFEDWGGCWTSVGGGNYVEHAYRMSFNSDNFTTVILNVKKDGWNIRCVR